MAIWYRGWSELPERLKADISGNPHILEAYTAPTGRLWYRERGAKEAADLLKINTEHHPTFDTTGERRD